MVPTNRPLPQKLSAEDKKYLSGIFITKDKFSIAKATSNVQGNFIVYGTNPQENLETTLSILSFLEAQKTVEYPRESIIYWTKNIDQYVDESVFDKNYHHTSLDTVAIRCNKLNGQAYELGRENMAYVYMDELTRGRDLFQLESKVSRYGNMVFLSIIAETIEEALYKCTTIQGSSVIAERNVGSLPSRRSELSHVF